MNTRLIMMTNPLVHKVLSYQIKNRKLYLPYSFQRFIAFITLITALPFFLMVALIIRIESKGSPFYSQNRVGHNGRVFKFYKFRSMYIKSDPRYVDVTSLKSDRDGVCKKFYKDPRITKVGRVIRKLSIDELPQLINIVKGDMVLIGPRPALPEEVANYDSHALQRLSVKPGLTGLWQVSGRADTTFEEQIELDLQYVSEKSLKMDLKILIGTIPAVLTGRGAY